MPEAHQTARWRARRPAASTRNPSVPEYLQPSSVAAVRELAELIAAAEWAPISYRGNDGKYVTERIVLGIMHGAAVGLGPFAAVHAIAVIDGHPTIWGDGALALVERSGLVQDMREDYTVDSEEGLTAICTMKRRLWPTPITRRFSMAMAEGAGLAQKEGPWRSYPRRMLMMRARSWALRDGFADVLRGLSIREEVEDYDDIGAPLPEPVSVSRKRHSRIATDPTTSRPRLADYIAAAMAARPQKEQPSGAVTNYGTIPAAGAPKTDHPLAVTANTPTADGSAVSSTNDNVEKDATAGNGVETATKPVNASALAITDAKEALGKEASSYTLVDAEGNFIEAANLNALRAAFDDLFSDRSQTPHKILGLWEFNEIARGQLLDAFGEPALEAALARQLAAAEHCNRGGPAQPAGQVDCSSAVGCPTLPEMNVEWVSPKLLLKINPTWSDEKILHHYQTRLLALRLRGATAQTFVDFRLSNQAIEERLRIRLPHLISDIDDVYRWCSTGAR